MAETTLARRLTAFDATMLVMGGIVGAGIFMNPAVVAQEDAAANDAKQSYRIAWPTWGRVAIAAMVLIAVGLAFLHLRPRGGQTVVVVGPPPAPELAPVVVVTGPAAVRAPGEVIEIVSIQPSALASNRYRPADDVVYRAPRVVIASGLSDRQDSGRLPF